MAKTVLFAYGYQAFNEIALQTKGYDYHWSYGHC